MLTFLTLKRSSYEKAIKIFFLSIFIYFVGTSASRLVINLNSDSLSIKDFLFLSIVAVPVIIKFPRIALYVILIEWFTETSLYADGVAGFAISERLGISIVLFFVVVIKNRFNLERIFSLREPIHWVLVLFLLDLIFSYSFMGDTYFAPMCVRCLYKYIILYIITLHLIRTPHNLYAFLKVYIYMMLFINLFAFYDYCSGGYLSYFRLMTAFEPNKSALNTLLALPFLLFIITNSKSNRMKFVYTLISLFLLFAIFLTGSRAGMGGLLFAAIIFFIYKMPNVNKTKYVIVFVLALIIVFFLAPSQIKDRFLKRTFVEFKDVRIATSISDLNYSAGSRVERAKAGIVMFFSNPIAGVGLGNYAYIAPRISFLTFSDTWQQAHCEYVRLLSELGLIGFFIYMILIYLTLKNFYIAKRIFIKNENIYMYQMTSVIMFSFLILLFVNIGLNALIYQAITYILIALSMRLKKIALQNYLIDIAITRIEGYSGAFPKSGSCCNNGFGGNCHLF